MSNIDTETIALSILRDLYERHPAFKGSWEPVYGKRHHIGDTCRSCGTHFRGLENDIKLLVKHELAHYTAEWIKQNATPWGDKDGTIRHYELSVEAVKKLTKVKSNG